MIDMDVPTEHRSVADDDPITDHAIVSDMNVPHEVAIAAYSGKAILFLGSAIDGDTFTYHISIANDDLRLATSIANVLRRSTEHRARRDDL